MVWVVVYLWGGLVAGLSQRAEVKSLVVFLIIIQMFPGRPVYVAFNMEQGTFIFFNKTRINSIV